MAQIVIEIPDESIDRISDAFSDHYGYQDKVSGENGKMISNPISKFDFMKENIIERIRTIVFDYEIKEHLISVKSDKMIEIKNISIL